MKILRECFLAAPGGFIGLILLAVVDMAVVIR